MKVKLLKGFNNGGRQYNPGDEFEGTPDEIDDLVRQGYADKPKEEAKAPPPPLPTKVKLTKGFNDVGRQYNPGDEFEGSPDQIDDLVRQGYAEKPEPAAASQAQQPDPTQQPQPDPAQTQNATGDETENPHHKKHSEPPPVKKQQHR